MDLASEIAGWNEAWSGYNTLTCRVGARGLRQGHTMASRAIV
jgi:hypothetical protein